MHTQMDELLTARAQQQSGMQKDVAACDCSALMLFQKKVLHMPH